MNNVKVFTNDDALKIVSKWGKYGEFSLAQHKPNISKRKIVFEFTDSAEQYFSRLIEEYNWRDYDKDYLEELTPTELEEFEIDMLGTSFKNLLKTFTTIVFREDIKITMGYSAENMENYQMVEVYIPDVSICDFPSNINIKIQ